jgi:hypothetical protein
MAKQQYAEFRFGGGYVSDLPLEAGAGYLRNGSSNAMVTGSGNVRAFRGLTAVGSVTGSRQHFLTDGGYAGLGEHNESGKGSVFKAYELLLFIGEGILKVNGVSTTRTADTALSYLLRDSGTYGAASPYYAVGHARPSAPQVYAKTPAGVGFKTISASVSVVIWRVNSLTGQTSLMSPTSAVLSVTNGSVIVQFPSVDANGQDYWGIGVPKLGQADLGALYQLPTDLNGEVAESTLAYTRTVTGCSIADTTNTVTSTRGVGEEFSSADIGRRISFGAFDSWITGIVSTSSVTVNDTNSSGGAISGTGTVTHAVDGYTRAIEISWADVDLLGQELAPDEAFEPPDGVFAGVLFDTFYVEDLEGTIFYSLPNGLYFPRDRRIFTDEKATCYIDSGDNQHWRIGKQTIGKMQYVGGDAPINFALKTKNIGCKYPVNACIGYNGRLMVWAGRPTVIDDSAINSTFHIDVSREFDGWDAQTEDLPVVALYDPAGQYELWIYQKKIMAYHAPSNRWCSPINLDIDGEIVAGVIADEKLRLVERDGTVLNQYIFDQGTGTEMTLVSHHATMPRDAVTITEIQSVVKVNGTDNTPDYTFTLIKNFDKEIALDSFTVSGTSPETQSPYSFRPNVRGVKTLAIKAVISNAKAYATVESLSAYGDDTQVFTR